MIDQTPLKFPISAQTLVPHREPMLFVDVLLERSGDKAKGQAVFPASGICCSSEGVLPEIFIELIAQTCAMANGYDCLVAGAKPRSGMLVGINSFKMHPFVRYGNTLLTIEVSKKIEFGPITLIEGWVWADDTLLAQGEIKVWEDLEADAEG